MTPPLPRDGAERVPHAGRARRAHRRRCRSRCGRRRPTSTSRRRRRSATTSSACATPSWGCRGRRGGPDRRVVAAHRNWLKKAALEVQEYVRLVRARRFAAMFTPAVLPLRHRRAVRRDRRAVADGRAADRVLHGRRAGAAERPDARSVRRAAGRRPAGQRVDDQGAGPGADRADADRPRRLGHRGRARARWW